jgi:S-adenosyl-L-methionine hydrolase (adenosine-forming)
MIFICVVDPGVGGEREMLCLQSETQWFLGPNNGIFHYLFKDKEVNVYRIKKDAFGDHSRTFHGRDLFTPAAIKIALGERDFLERFDHNKLISLDVLDKQSLVTYIDSFGNIKTNIAISAEPAMNSRVELKIDGKKYTLRWQSVFTDVGYGEPLCYKGSNDTLEIAVNNGSAQVYFNADIGSIVSAKL